MLFIWGGICVETSRFHTNCLGCFHSGSSSQQRAALTHKLHFFCFYCHTNQKEKKNNIDACLSSVSFTRKERVHVLPSCTWTSGVIQASFEDRTNISSFPSLHRFSSFACLLSLSPMSSLASQSQSSPTSPVSWRATPSTLGSLKVLEVSAST